MKNSFKIEKWIHRNYGNFYRSNSPPFTYVTNTNNDKTYFMICNYKKDSIIITREQIKKFRNCEVCLLLINPDGRVCSHIKINSGNHLTQDHFSYETKNRTIDKDKFISSINFDELKYFFDHASTNKGVLGQHEIQKLLRFTEFQPAQLFYLLTYDEEAKQYVETKVGYKFTIGNDLYGRTINIKQKISENEMKMRECVA